MSDSATPGFTIAPFAIQLNLSAAGAAGAGSATTGAGAGAGAGAGGNGAASFHRRAADDSDGDPRKRVRLDDHAGSAGTNGSSSSGSRSVAAAFHEDDAHGPSSDGAITTRFLSAIQVKSAAEEAAEAAAAALKASHIVIPLIKNNRWGVALESQPGTNEDAASSTTGTTGAATAMDVSTSNGEMQASSRGTPTNAAAGANGTLTAEEEAAALAQTALSELLQDSAAITAGNVEQKTIPLMMQNRIPGAENLSSEADVFRLDVSLRPDDINYNAVPVEAFGMAMLRGMGVSDKDMISARNQLKDAVPRANRLGLGAKPKSEALANNEPPPTSAKSAAKQQQAQQAKNAAAAAAASSTAPAVPAPPKKQVVFLPGLTKRDGSAPPRSDSATDANLAEAVRPIETVSIPAAASSRPAAMPPARPPLPFAPFAFKTSWLAENLRVRVVSRSYKDGKYDGVKVVLTEIDRERLDRFICKTEDDRTLTDLRERDLESVVPREIGAKVLILSGTERGRIGLLHDRDSSRQRVKVKLPSEPFMATLNFDEVCEIAAQLPGNAARR
ncbi:hypothetical protein CAOG_03529 [Capsaspora owczarzaki ATCC 30864]|nr:hypothetical protein CAOG_03529 [Capsaspora owczarzaki ATCC 30864]|eukprot:XP_004348434.1 hypothetical protein CAOG_03529 [Capsaspora owczarzaki ATCC 30864]